LVEKIGVSVYSPKQLEAVLENYDINLVQLPLNILDQRMQVSGMLEILKERNIEIHTRSTFLQGLILMEPSELPKNLQVAKVYLEKLRAIAYDLNVDVITIALAYLLKKSEVDYVLVGVTNNMQLKQIIEFYQAALKLDMSFEEYLCNDLEIIDPSTW